MNEMATIQGNDLIRAVAAVMAGVHRLAKDDSNDFAKYKFTSVDDFKDHLRPLLAANGLGVRMTELECETFEALNSKGGKSLMAKFVFGLQLVHESGAEDLQERTTIVLPYAAAQTTGQARSYALKEWLKSKFLASSGDITEDVDSQPTGEYRSTLPKKDARPMYTKLEKALDEIERDPDSTAAKLQAWQTANKSDIESLPDDWLAPLRQRYTTVLHTLKTRQPLGNGGTKGKAALATEAGQRFRDAQHQAAFDAQAPHNAETGEVSEDDSFANYDGWVSEMEVRLNAASDEEQGEIWDIEIAPRIEDGKVFPPDVDRLKRLLRNTA